jgi:hypothetical protein
VDVAYEKVDCDDDDKEDDLPGSTKGAVTR